MCQAQLDAAAKCSGRGAGGGGMPASAFARALGLPQGPVLDSSLSASAFLYHCLFQLSGQNTCLATPCFPGRCPLCGFPILWSKHVSPSLPPAGGMLVLAHLAKPAVLFSPHPHCKHEYRGRKQKGGSSSGPALITSLTGSRQQAPWT